MTAPNPVAARAAAEERLAQLKEENRRLRQRLEDLKNGSIQTREWAKLFTEGAGIDV